MYKDQTSADAMPKMPPSRDEAMNYGTGKTTKESYNNQGYFSR